MNLTQDHQIYCLQAWTRVPFSPEFLFFTSWGGEGVNMRLKKYKKGIQDFRIKTVCGSHAETLWYTRDWQHTWSAVLMNKVYIIVCSDKLSGKKKHHLHVDNNNNKKLKNTWMFMETTVYHLEFITWWLAILYKQITFKQCHNDSQSNKATNSTLNQIVNAWRAHKNPPFKSIRFQMIWQHVSYLKEGLDIVHSNTMGQHSNSENTANCPKSTVRLEKLVS